MNKPAVLLILDGWGLAPPGPGNAISLAQLSVIPKLWTTYPHAQLSASGISVGLPEEEDGNTETGHLNIGAGRIVYQDLPRINMSISDGSFYKNEAFTSAITYAKLHNSTMHVMGVLSDAGVHASREHLYALLTLFKSHGCQCPVYIHVFTDGRDSSPTSGKRFVQELESKCASIGIGTIATVMGRYYAMDRDHRWERTERAYEALTSPIESRAATATAAIEASYAKGKTDEFIEPVIITDSKGTPYPRITNHDAVIFYNYRIDRPRQLTRAFILSDFEEQKITQSFDPYAVKYFHKHVVEESVVIRPFTRKVTLPNIFFVTMTEYERGLSSVVAYPPEHVPNPIASVFSDLKLRQLHASETEKERFVTYYFNGLQETPFELEDRLIIPSPKVATYDLQPEMSAQLLTDKFVDRLALGTYAFAVINFANPDMVAHTGNIPAAVKACEVTDAAVGRIVTKTLAMDGTCVITADHGNVEEMLGPNGEMDTEHSTYPVPFIMIHSSLMNRGYMLRRGMLSDIAPTLLSWLKLPIPSSMTGRDLLKEVL